jgi:branched-chain amino acid transport system ATP-binding protein
MASQLEARSIHAGYGEVKVVKGINIAVAAGSITAVVGSNGAGKTTLMRTLSGLIPAWAGSIHFEGADISREPAHQRVARGISLVPEGRLVFPGLTVHETLRIGAFAGRARSLWQQRRSEMYELFPRLKLRRTSRAGSLSGGEQQMLALARGLMSRPTLLLLDEPSLGLSPALADEVFERLDMIRKAGVTICIVEQNVQAALSLADYAYVLEEGQVTMEGAAATLMTVDAIRGSYLGL